MGLKESAIELIRRCVKVPVEAYTGAIKHRLRHRKELKAIPTVREAIGTLERRWSVGPDPYPDDPVFVLSAGWRSGSTLLQRLVMSSQKILVWGEPYDHCTYVQQLAASLRAFTGEYPPDFFFLRHQEEKWGFLRPAAAEPAQAATKPDRSVIGKATPTAGERTPPGADDVQTAFWDRWIGNLYPHPAELRASHRAFFDRLFAQPARERGFSRWGLKEVRLSTSDALYLKWLFPKARFLFLIRNPYSAYRSYRLFRPWYDRWPELPVFTAKQYGELWLRLAGDFLRRHADVDGRLVLFEELTGESPGMGALSEYLDLPLRTEVLARRVRGRGKVEPGDVPRIELRILRKAVEPLASDLGYHLASHHTD